MYKYNNIVCWHLTKPKITGLVILLYLPNSKILFMENRNFRYIIVLCTITLKKYLFKLYVIVYIYAMIMFTSFYGSLKSELTQKLITVIYDIHITYISTI